MNLSAKEIERVKFTFSIYDFEGKNVMDAFNLGDALRALGLNPTLNRIEKLGGTNRRREKILQVEEFLAIYADAKKDKDVGSVEDFLECLKCYDKKGEGKMSAAELNHVLLSYGEKLEPEESKAILTDCADSPDDDGLISYKLFLNRLVGNISEKEPRTSEILKPTPEISKPTPEIVTPEISSPPPPTTSKPKKTKKAAAAEVATSSTQAAEEEASVMNLKPSKPRSGSVTTTKDPKAAPMEKKFQMPLISMKTDKLFK